MMFRYEKFEDFMKYMRVYEVNQGSGNPYYYLEARATELEKSEEQKKTKITVFLHASALAKDRQTQLLHVGQIYSETTEDLTEEKLFEIMEKARNRFIEEFQNNESYSGIQWIRGEVSTQ